MNGGKHHSEENTIDVCEHQQFTNSKEQQDNQATRASVVGNDRSLGWEQQIETAMPVYH